MLRLTHTKEDERQIINRETIIPQKTKLPFLKILLFVSAYFSSVSHTQTKEKSLSGRILWECPAASPLDHQKVRLPQPQAANVAAAVLSPKFQLASGPVAKRHSVPGYRNTGCSHGSLFLAAIVV